ncbi:MAG: DNA repair protein RadA [Clostridia bacterium]|nr:DNA repair protein RadA [Clostridia bacterium]
MKGLKTIYICSSCEYESIKWAGKCPRCGAWNSFVEDVIELAPKDGATKKSTPDTRHSVITGNSAPQSIDDVREDECIRNGTGLGELDRVLGGGLVRGSAVLLTGEPGIGKSTLLLQISGILSRTRKVLYVSGEESAGQIKLRAKRLGVTGSSLLILSETNTEKIIGECASCNPDVLIVDSVQTMFTPEQASSPGSVTQVRESALSFISMAKNDGVSVILVGHVNKEGSIAGPKLLEHMVDSVLCFEGERQQAYRIIRAVKNRFGSTDEIGVFEMTDKGLCEVPNPSEVLLAGRPKNVSGNCAVCTVEGTRPVIAEIQALACQTSFPSPRRTVNGIDYNRMCMISAVLEKRLGLKFSSCDLYLNVIGGLRLDEPATDAALALSMISSITDRIVPDSLAAIGEIGLSGECRAVSSVEARVRECERLGFTQIVIPFRNIEKRPIEVGPGITLLPVKSVYELLLLLGKPGDSGNNN